MYSKTLFLLQTTDSSATSKRAERTAWVVRGYGYSGLSYPVYFGCCFPVISMLTLKTMLVAKEGMSCFRFMVKNFHIHSVPISNNYNLALAAFHPLRSIQLCKPISSCASSLKCQGKVLSMSPDFQCLKTTQNYSCREFSTKHDSPHSKLRTPLRRVKRDSQRKQGFSVSGFSTAEEYDLELLKTSVLKHQLYRQIEDEEMWKMQQGENRTPNVLHVVANYAVEEEPREVFFFREGTVVFWNVSELEIANLLRFIRPFEIGSYDEQLVLDEKEVMSFIHSGSKKSALQGGIIHLTESKDYSLEKYTFSNGIALSVKLGIWEATLDDFIDSIEYITEDLKMGNKIRMSREEVLRKQGELFALRHLINLSSDLLDTPDFYWDNDELENLFAQTVAYLSIGRRTRVMNEKLNHCVELVELVSSHLNDKHHVRLEWMIIILIMVEVVFEVLHFMR